MLALIGPRGNGRTKKLAQWALASGGTIIVDVMARAEHIHSRYNVPMEQLVTVAQIRSGAAPRSRTHASLVAIDDVDNVLQSALGITSPIQLVAFYGGAMQP